MKADHDSLVKSIAADYAGTIYVPERPRGGGTSCNTDAERHADDPAVLAAAEDYFGDPDRLHGDRLSSQTILRERPVHRSMIYLHAMGATYREIAEQTGYNYHQVRAVLSQPWARQRLVQILNETGKDQIKHFLTHEVSPSLEVLKTIRDEGKKDSDRLVAANAILDRALGKPLAKVESSNTNRTVPADLQRLERELAEVRKQLEDKGHTVN